MGHWRAMMDSDWLRACDLAGREPTVTISKVVGGVVTGEGGKKSRKPVLYFQGKAKPLAIGATIGKTIEGMYGPKTEDWIGKRITLFESTTQSTGGQIVQCIRIRPMVPGASTPVSTSRPEPDDSPPAGVMVDDETEDERNRRLAAPADGEMGS